MTQRANSDKGHPGAPEAKGAPGGGDVPDREWTDLDVEDECALLMRQRDEAHRRGDQIECRRLDARLRLLQDRHAH